MTDKNILNTKEKIEIAVQTGLQLVPYVGPALSAAYFGTKNEKRFKRIESFYEEISQLQDHLKEPLPPVESHNEDELIALIEILNDKIEREHTNEKRTFFKQFFLNTLATPKQGNFDEKRFFLETLAAMSLLECELLSFLYSEQNKGNSPINVGTINKPGIEQYAIVGAIGRLKMYGFLSAVTNSFAIGGGDNNLQENVSLTNFGLNFVHFCLA
ncbi:hypothetical protein [Bacillus sp. KH172YL63]|uniref:hypothetical protein n=1 Tax=Bacillus sp. KH172YL63 TaxID=2709784 RepID=UPI0013E43FAB|nr:hypothetical protein [Bacillus sp. KH172YL63]BCB04734.1 hypothetical protein KH172YL63_28670 [Bacillus sp. KH172YL63]